MSGRSNDAFHGGAADRDQHLLAPADWARELRYCAAEAGILRDFAAIPYRRFTAPY